MVQAPSQSLVFSLHLLQWASHSPQGEQGSDVGLARCRHMGREVERWYREQGGSCLPADERGLGNVLPVPLASGCQALPSAATAYTG